MPLACAIGLVAVKHASVVAGEPAPADWVRRGGATGFAVGAAERPFVPWGFNYDHDRDGRLLEDYWHDEWPTVVEDFREMRALGANVVRIHLQVGRFLKGPQEVDERNLARLKELVRLAEQERLYLDLTGLGCYHKADVPSWYDMLDETGRWEAQARFWEAIARVGATSPAIFCYDLMNEPVSPAGPGRAGQWLGPPFGDKHFVQYISLEPRGRARPAIAREWIARLSRSIRQVDAHHLITVGLVDWSLDRPGLTSGFVPQQIADQLDFLCVHLYPRTGRLTEDLETLAGFAAVGKPVVIEETFPLQCSADEFREFLRASRRQATGWIGFYWGQTVEELTARQRELQQPPAGADRFREAVGVSLQLQWLTTFRRDRPDP
ncbi:MAG: cellulase family glycosylhydrolase [Pirellulales bacterium]